MNAPAIPQELLDAAARLLDDEGPEGFTIERLAQRMGLSRATVYRQSGGREALLDALEARGADVGDRSDVRTRILAGAREVFGREGFEGATVEQVAAAARVGVATIYRYFGDKEGLVAAFLEQLAPRRAVREARAAASGDLRADLERLAERVLSGMRDDAPMMRLLLLETLRGSPLLPRVRAAAPVRTVAALAALMQEHLAAGRLRPGLDAHLLAQSFGGMILAFGVIAPVLRGEPAADPAATARALTGLFLDGALARGGAR